MKKKQGVQLLLLILLVVSLCACKSKEHKTNVVDQSNQEKAEETEEGMKDTVILTPEGEFLDDSGSGDSEKEEGTDASSEKKKTTSEEENSVPEKDSPISNNSNEPSDKTEAETPAEEPEKGNGSNPFHLDKDGDGFADGWY